MARSFSRGRPAEHGAVVLPNDVLAPLSPAGRVFRRPSHTFNTQVKGYDPTMMYIAPVLPGETLENILLQARVVTKPLKQSIMGLWFETYHFYVKLRHLANADEMIAMMLTNAAPASGAASVPYYHNGEGPNYSLLAMNNILEWYFRDADEAVDQTAGGTRRSLKLKQTTWLDSVKLASAAPVADSELLGDLPDLPDGLDPSWQTAYDQWKMMRETRMTTASWEDYLATFGIKSLPAKREEELKPELLRYDSEWTYPSNTIDPLTGAATSAGSWAVATRADKARFFNEPGFIVGVSCLRFKTFMSKQLSSGVSMLNDAYSWLPALLQDDSFTSLKKYTSITGPLKGQASGDYWVDLRDLFIHGDQFTNYGIANVGNLVNVPYADTTWKYPLALDVDNFFVDNTKPYASVDGVCQLSIKGHQRDTT